MHYFPRYRIRPKIAPSDHSFFHCVSHVVDRRHVFGEEEKSMFLFFLRRYERFCKVQIVGYCLMGDHFHVLVRVPGRPEQQPTLAVLMQHVRETLGEKIMGQYQERIDFWEEQVAIGQRRKMGELSSIDSPLDVILGLDADLVSYAGTQLEKVSQDIWNRMYDVSQFVFSLKQQFSHWYNKEHDRVGTLWEERFRSALVQPGPAVAEVAAYLDLNPVRNGMVKCAKDYAWSQYGAAVRGDGLALKALGYLHALSRPKASPRQEPFDWKSVPGMGPQMVFAYIDCLLRLRGDFVGDAQPRDPSAVEPLGVEEWAENPMPGASYVKRSWGRFTRGVAVGEPGYLEEIFEANRDQFGLRRQAGSRKIWVSGPCRLATLRGAC